jgi:ligand-binding sensor domain-containing protein/signal transduction histidine kinase
LHRRAAIVMIHPHMSRAFLALLTVCCVLVFTLNARASDNDSDPLGDYTVTTWNDKEGLPAGRIRAIEQDIDGYLWLGTDVGLVRFDGVRFTSWTALSAGPPVTGVNALMSSRDGSLWVSVSERGLIRIKHGASTLYSEHDGFARSFVFALAEDHQGTVWAGTLQGLYRFSQQRWERLGTSRGLVEGAVLAVYEDSARRLWIATPTAIYRRADASSSFERVDDIELSNTSQHFSEDSNGEIWITDFQRGFRSANPSTPDRPHDARRGWGAHLLHDHRGNFWVATLGQGLWRVKSDPVRRTTVETITVRNGLSSDAVQTMVEDREGNLWVGTRAGLQRLSPRRVTRLTDLPIPRALETSPDGSVWVGTASGLMRFSGGGRQLYGERDGLPGSVVLALHADRAGTLWVASERGLARFQRGRFSGLLVPRGNQIERIFAITSSGESVWFRDFYRGLFRWQEGAFARVEDMLDAQAGRPLAVHADRAGNVWIGSAGGKLGVRRASGEFELYGLDIGEILTIHEDAAGVLWVGGEDGLAQFSGQHATTVDRRNGFPGDVKSIIDDSDGNLWLGLDAGIAKLVRTEFAEASADRSHQIQYRLFSGSDGVAGLPAALGSRSAVRAADGRLWFVTSAGITIVDPRNLGNPPRLPPVRLETVSADGRPVDLAAGTALPPRTSHVQFAFTSLALTDPMRVRFRYRLDGFDRSWIDAGGNRQASYTNLSPGQYRFQVEASNNDGLWTEPGTIWLFSVRPTFYQTKSFYVAIALATTLTIWGLWWMRVRRVRQQFALVLAERVRMSRTIHDSLLQGLVAIALQFDDLSHSLEVSSPAVREHIIRIRKNVERYIKDARHSIWELRSPTLDTRDLAGAIRDAGERAVEGRTIRFDFTVNGVPRLFPRETEEQLLHIGQEAIQNAVRHAQPSRVTAELRYETKHLTLRVFDDGSGFDLSGQGGNGHYGIVSMRERAEQAGGSLAIVTSPGSGTSVETVVPCA